MDLLTTYSSESSNPNSPHHPLLLSPSPQIFLPSNSSAPEIDCAALALKTSLSGRLLRRPLDPSEHSIYSFNLTHNQIWAPLQGPAHPFAADRVACSMRNHKLGSVEDASIHSFLFDEQYHTFHKYGEGVRG